MGILTALLLVLSTVGYGALLFKALRIGDVGSPSLVIGLCFAAGYGLIGWLMFTLGVAGILVTTSLWVLVAVGLIGLVALRGRISINTTDPFTVVQIGLLALLLVVGIFDVLQALAPPSDADSLAYHFALPKQFLAAGEIFFVPRAIDGAVPLLVQMGYIPALGLGGEQALTFWTMFTSWAVYILVYGLARTKISTAWSLATTLAIATTPTVIYGSGSGQVEIRIAMFVLLAAWAAAKTIETKQARYILLCGLAAGLYGGSKYLGLIFMTSTGLVIIMQPHWIRAGLVFSIAAMIAGGQWYLWNFLNTGDPVFPMLFPVVGVSDPTIWDIAHHDMLQNIFLVPEKPVPVTPLGFLSYPFVATFSPPHRLDAGRAGLGPFLVLLLPFVIAAITSRKTSWQWNTVAVWSAMVIGFFTLWFFLGSPQRIRHLLPVWPLAVILMFIAVQKCANSWHIGRSIGIVIGVVLCIQLGAAGLFALKFVDVATGRVSPETFRKNNISHYAPVPWLNVNLNDTHRVLTTERLHLYDLDVPSYFAQDVAQAIIPIHPEFGTKDLVSRLQQNRISHMVIYTALGAGETDFPMNFKYLAERNCVQQIHSGESTAIASRTLAGQRSILQFHVLKFTPDRCRPGS